MTSQTPLPSNHTCRAEPCHESSRADLPRLDVDRRRSLLGLPCACCAAYYAVALDSCPVCGCTERLLADAPWRGWDMAKKMTVQEVNPARPHHSETPCFDPGQSRP